MNYAHYRPDHLEPVSLDIDEDGDPQTVYNLPAPVEWPTKELRSPVGPEKWVRLTRSISRVRICVCTSYPNNGPTTIIVPIKSDGEELPLNAVILKGVASPFRAFHKLGFAPDLSAQ